MPQSRQRDPSIERTQEYEDFIQQLAAYHEKRGLVAVLEGGATNTGSDR